MDIRSERRALSGRVDILIGTPGRLVDHLNRNSFYTDNLQVVALDEADEMLDMGFREDLETLLKAAPEHRRTLMFSATVPRTIAAMARRYQTRCNSCGDHFGRRTTSGYYLSGVFGAAIRSPECYYKSAAFQ